ncbi:NAD-dependent epimerase/dehydratase family protein [Paenibacillus sp. CC-CFT747]|nr:NAD-dependent epimerase/dehydratase family protein [Paenibacillus sp. CC-CFT747]
MNVLVLGGTKFFGKRLVNKLAARGHEVTVATRGRSLAEGLDHRVRRVTVDRTDGEAMMNAFGDRSYDVVYDQIGFTPQDARTAVETFGSRIRRYVFTSSMAVYEDTNEVIREEAFDPHRYRVDLDRGSYDYQEGKRQAEACLYQNAPFPVTAVRVSLVISGEDDYTGRFAYHVDKVRQGKPIGILQPFSFSYIAADELAGFLYFLGIEAEYAGPVNANNTGWLSMEEFVEELEKGTGGTSGLYLAGEGEEKSPYSMGATYKLSNERAAALGFSFRPVRAAIAEEVKRYLGVPIE